MSPKELITSSKQNQKDGKKEPGTSVVADTYNPPGPGTIEGWPEEQIEAAEFDEAAGIKDIDYEDDEERLEERPERHSGKHPAKRSKGSRPRPVVPPLSDAETRMFIGDRSDYYIRKWRMLRQASVPLGWNWGAAIFGPVWLAYRKMYLFTFLWAIVFMLGGWVPLIGILWFLLCNMATGIVGDLLYYEHAKRKIRNIAVMSDSKAHRRALFISKGGTGLIAPLIIIMLIGLIVVGIAVLYVMSRLLTEVSHQFGAWVQTGLSYILPWVNEFLDQLLQFF